MALIAAEITARNMTVTWTNPKQNLNGLMNFITFANLDIAINTPSIIGYDISEIPRFHAEFAIFNSFVHVLDERMLVP